ncbi:MAG: diphthamide biosynthesis enzyme Dph2 [Thermoprotei archaeon]
MSYDFDLTKVFHELERRNPKRVLLQFPEGLRHYSVKVLDELRGHFPDVEFLVSAEPSWGACDLADDEAQLVKADVIVHFGHTPYPWYSHKIPTVYVPVFSKLDLSDEVLLELARELTAIGAKRVNVSAVLQHVHLVPKVKEFLRAKGFEAFSGFARPPFMLEGQVLGCDYYAVRDDAEAYVNVSGGLFHSLGVALTTMKPTFKLDPYEGRVVDVTREAYRVLKVRMAKVFEARDKGVWGIIQGMKLGQNRPTLVELLRRGLEKKGKRVYVFTNRVTTKDALRNLPPEIEVFVVTSCPRVPTDDLYDFEKPVLTPGEAKMIINDDLNNYIFPW